MKYLAPILVIFSLVELTSPGGFPLFVSRDQVTAVGDAAAGYVCAPTSNARILTSAGSFCVTETPQEVVRRLRETPPAP